jgi:hypothetical protein
MHMRNINVEALRREIPRVYAQIRALRDLPDVTIFSQEISIDGDRVTIKIEYRANESHRDIFEAA